MVLAATAHVITSPSTPHTALHQLTPSCWCQPATAFDGHTGTHPIFEALDGDPIDAAGYPIEVEL